MPGQPAAPLRLRGSGAPPADSSPQSGVVSVAPRFQLRLAAELVADGGRAASGPELLPLGRVSRSRGTATRCSSSRTAADQLVASTPPDRPERSPATDSLSPWRIPWPRDLRRAPASVFRVDPGDGTIVFSGARSGSGVRSVRPWRGHSAGGRGPRPPGPGRPPATSACFLGPPPCPQRARPRTASRSAEPEAWLLAHHPGTETTREKRAGFFTAYTETMARTDAAGQYFFSEVLQRILSAKGNLLRAPEGGGCRWRATGRGHRSPRSAAASSILPARAPPTPISGARR